MFATLLYDLFLSTLRWLLGLTGGAVVGLLLGSLGAIRQLDRGFLGHVLNFARAIPILGLVPVVQMTVGVEEYGKIGLIAWAVAFPVWLSIRDARSRSIGVVEGMFPKVFDSRSSFFRHILFPRICGGFFLGIEIGIGVAWLSVVAAEWIGTFNSGFWSGGLGYRLIVAYEANDWVLLITILILFGSMGLVSMVGWKSIGGSVFRLGNGFDPIAWLSE